MANKDSKILDELRRRGNIFEDSCPGAEGIIDKLIDIFSKRKKDLFEEIICLPDFVTQKIRIL